MMSIGARVDLTTTDERAWSLAPSLLLSGGSPDAQAWTNPATGTACVLEPSGAYVVLRRAGERVTPVVAGEVLEATATRLLAAPDTTESRRAAAHAIIAVDRGVGEATPGTGGA